MKKLFLLAVAALLSFPVLAQTDIVKTDTVGAEDMVFLQVDVEPEFPGGLDSLFRFIWQNTQYPQKAVRNNITGKVYVTFVIEKDGSVSNVEVLRGVHKLLDKEAVRVTKLLPRWSPAMENGRPVRFRFNLPYVFVLQ